ncbi:MAG: hypothetical protein AAF654_02730 [Myxococcota bacterium]
MTNDEYTYLRFLTGAIAQDPSQARAFIDHTQRVTDEDQTGLKTSIDVLISALPDEGNSLNTQGLREIADTLMDAEDESEQIVGLVLSSSL